MVKGGGLFNNFLACSTVCFFGRGGGGGSGFSFSARLSFSNPKLNKIVFPLIDNLFNWFGRPNNKLFSIPFKAKL